VRLYLVRHGQTPSHVRMSLNTRPPGPGLTQEGERQALDVAEQFATEPITAVYASTALRAQQTAAPIAAKLGLPLKVIDGVHEVYVGDLEDRNDEPALHVFFDVYKAWLADRFDVAIPGGESAADVFARALPALDALRHAHEADDAIVLVSHGALIRLTGYRLAHNVTEPLAGHALLPNCGRVVLDTDPDSPTGWRCTEWNGVLLPQSVAD
jgi:broad specificity phosphatase PhoE